MDQSSQFITHFTAKKDNSFFRTISNRLFRSDVTTKQHKIKSLIKNINSLDSMLEKASSRLIQTTNSNRKFMKQLNKVQTIQSVQLHKIYKLRCFFEIENDTSKSYLDSLSENQKSVFLDTYSAEVYIAAKSLTQTANSGTENTQTQQLKDFAVNLCDKMKDLKYKISNYIVNNNENIKDCLNEFDKSFIGFEQLICSYAFLDSFDKECSPIDIEAFEWFVDIFANSITHLIDNETIGFEMIDTFSPELIVLIPRMAILEILIKYYNKINDCGLVSNQSINVPAMPQEKMQVKIDRNLKLWIENGIDLFNDLKNEIIEDDQFNLNLLKEVNGIILNGNYQNKCSKSLEIYKKICAIADGLHSGKNATKFSLVLEKAFAYNQNL